MSKKILLRGSWQTRNIGDIAHTPGILQILEQYIPEAEITLWPCQINLGVREMLLTRFPKLKLAENEADLPQLFSECDLYLQGSGPCISCDSVRTWRKYADGKPYGFFGVSADGLWTQEKRDILSEAGFIYCRDSLSRDFLRQQELACPVIEFGPDATFGLHLRNEAPARKFLHENGLEDGKYICMIPRLRFTPQTFDENHFHYPTPKRENPSMEHVESDMEKMRSAIQTVLTETDLKVLICPEMTYQIPMGRRYLYERLPESNRSRVVWRPDYWITDEAQSIYSHGHSLLSMEMHSPIIFISEGLPAILLRQSQDTWKGQMWRDIGLQDWILELDVTDAATISDRLLSIIRHYPEAKQKAQTARRFALEKEREAILHIRKLLFA